MNKNKNKFKQTGVTLIEMSLVVAIMAVTSLYYYKAKINASRLEYRETLAKKTIGEVQAITRAAQSYFIEAGSWPDNANNCAGAIAILTNPSPSGTVYLPVFPSAHPYGASPYTTICNAPAQPNHFSVDIIVDVPAADNDTDEEYAQYITNQYPGVSEWLPDLTPAIGGVKKTVRISASSLGGSSLKVSTIQLGAIPENTIPIPVCTAGQNEKIHLALSGVGATNAKAMHAYRLYVNLNVNANGMGISWTPKIEFYDDNGPTPIDSNLTYVTAITLCE